MKKFAIILSGCGVYDGSEIHEAVCTMLAIKRRGGDYQCFAPDRDQAHVVNHLTGQPTGETRNALAEAARIARGNIKPITDYNPADYDGVIFPGGFGAAKNLCDYAFQGPRCQPQPDIALAIRRTVEAGKRIGAECIAPVLITSVLKGCQVTIGHDEATAADIAQIGGRHVEADHNGVVRDPGLKLYTTPCYMEAADIAQVAESADALVAAMMED